MKYTAEEMRARLDFVISDREPRILTWKSGGCHPASIAECALWDVLAERIEADEGVVNKLVVPVAQGESGVIRHVGDSRFESWFSEYVVGQNGAKQQARDAYGAGLAEQAERLAAQPAQSVDVAKVREVIAHLRSFRYNTPPTWAHLDDAADKLAAALQEGEG